MDEVAIEPGDLLISRAGYEVRVMAVAEKWLMVRCKGCAPFLIDLRTARELPLAKQGQRPKGWKVTV